MKIYNCGGEGIRLRYFVTNCTIFHNRITSTGCYDFKFGGDQGIKNGEGICELCPNEANDPSSAGPWPSFSRSFGGFRLRTPLVPSLAISDIDIEVVAC